MFNESELDRIKITPPELSAAQQKEVDEAWDTIHRARAMMTEGLVGLLELYRKHGFEPPSQSGFDEFKVHMSDSIYNQLWEACDVVGETVSSIIDGKVSVRVAGMIPQELRPIIETESHRGKI